MNTKVSASSKAEPPRGVASVVPDAMHFSAEDVSEFERLKALMIAEPTNERRKQELSAFKIAKGIA